MANTSHSQQRLASDETFHARVRSALAIVAWQVISEDVNTANHAEREGYARNTVLPNLSNVAVQIAPWLVERGNLLGEDTSYDFVSGNIVTAASDAAIESQLSSDWNVLAGV